MKWMWKWGRDATPFNVIPFCPNCDYQIIPQFASAFRMAPRYSYKCEDCGYNCGDFEGEFERLQEKVILKTKVSQLIILQVQ